MVNFYKLFFPRTIRPVFFIRPDMTGYQPFQNFNFYGIDTKAGHPCLQSVRGRVRFYIVSRRVYSGQANTSSECARKSSADDIFPELPLNPSKKQAQNYRDRGTGISGHVPFSRFPAHCEVEWSCTHIIR